MTTIQRMAGEPFSSPNRKESRKRLFDLGLRAALLLLTIGCSTLPSFAQDIPRSMQSPDSFPPRRSVKVINSEGGGNPGQVQLPENYVLTLVATPENAQPLEMSMTTASPQFKMDAPGTGEESHPGVSFSGAIVPEEGGARVLVHYVLGIEIAMPTSTTSSVGDNGKEQVRSKTIQYKASTASGSVWLKAGEPLQVLKASGWKWQLRVEKAAPAESSK